MYQPFIDAFFNKKEKLENLFSKKHPESYLEIVENVVSILPEVDPKRIHEIDDGDYQGTLIYIIGEEGYQPNKYWYVCIGYGSCSGCDTLKSIWDYSQESPTKQQVKDYITLALHVVQGLTPCEDY